MLESLFNRVAGLKACNFIKRDSDTATQVFSCEYCEIFKNTYSKEIFEQLPLEFLRLTVNISSKGLVSALNAIVPL